MRRVLAAVAILLGVLLIAIAVVALIVAWDGARHGWASLEDAAPIPVLAIAVGVAMALGGVVALRRR